MSKNNIKNLNKKTINNSVVYYKNEQLSSIRKFQNWITNDWFTNFTKIQKLIVPYFIFLRKIRY